MANEIGTFTELKQLIDQAISDGRDEVTLEKDYKYSASTDPDSVYRGIEVFDTTLKINGNNHTIDGGIEGARAFRLTNVKMQLQNLEFTQAGKRLKAGHIQSDDSYLSLINCTFKNGYTYDYAGSVYASGGYLNIVNCYFEKNTCINETPPTIQRCEGGSLYSYDSPLSVAHSEFESCKGELGGAISVNERAYFNNCKFNKNITPNTFLGSKGGAIWAKADLHITNCEFTENVGEEKGGAIASERHVYLKNSRFVENTCGVLGKGSSKGGAVYSDTKVTSDSCDFIQNYASREGGAIHTPNLTTEKSKFIENVSASYAGAIRLDGGDIQCKQNSFEHNQSSDSDTIYGDADHVIIRGNWWGTPTPDWDTGLIIINGEKQRDEDPAPSPI